MTERGGNDVFDGDEREEEMKKRREYRQDMLVFVHHVLHSSCCLSVAGGGLGRVEVEELVYGMIRQMQRSNFYDNKLDGLDDKYGVMRWGLLK